jgi:hypothetical protein
MKNLSVVILALFLAAPAFSDEIQAPVVPVSLSVDATVVSEVDSLQLADLGAFLDKKVQEVTDLLTAKIAAELPGLVNQEASANIKF